MSDFKERCAQLWKLVCLVPMPVPVPTDKVLTAKTQTDEYRYFRRSMSLDPILITGTGTYLRYRTIYVLVGTYLFYHYLRSRVPT